MSAHGFTRAYDPRQKKKLTRQQLPCQRRLSYPSALNPFVSVDLNHPENSCNLNICVTLTFETSSSKSFRFVAAFSPNKLQSRRCPNWFLPLPPYHFSIPINFAVFLPINRSLAVVPIGLLPLQPISFSFQLILLLFSIKPQSHRYPHWSLAIATLFDPN